MKNVLPNLDPYRPFSFALPLSLWTFDADLVSWDLKEFAEAAIKLRHELVRSFNLNPILSFLCNLPGA